MAAARTGASELNRIADEMMERGDATSGRFDPPYTTVHVGTIEGGTARNILAKRLCVPLGVPRTSRSRPERDPGPRTLRERGRSEAPQPLRRYSAGSRPCWKWRCRGSLPIRARRPRLWRCAFSAATRPDRAFRDGGRALSGGRHPHRRVRPGLDQPGASAGRVHHPRAARAGAAFMRRLAQACA